MNCIQENGTLPSPHQKKTYKACNIILRKGNIREPESRFSETPQEPREATRAAFLTTVTCLNGFLGKRWRCSALVSRGLSGNVPPQQDAKSEAALLFHCPPVRADTRKVPGTEYHGILELLIWQELRDVLVYYFHFIIKETGQEKFGNLAKMTQELRPDPEFSLLDFNLLSCLGLPVFCPS